jgi:tetratricopeptide (TPR) repeat protein
MRGIMAKLDEREKTLTSEDGDSEASEALNAAKSALASDHNDRAADLFLKAIDVATRAEDGAAELSARRGYAMALAAQRKFADAASALEAYLPRSSALNQREGDSAVYGLLGDVYTDLGAFDKAGAAYDACINVMDD